MTTESLDNKKLWLQRRDDMLVLQFTLTNVTRVDAPDGTSTLKPTRPTRRRNSPSISRPGRSWSRPIRWQFRPTPATSHRPPVRSRVHPAHQRCPRRSSRTPVNSPSPWGPARSRSSSPRQGFSRGPVSSATLPTPH